MAVAPREPSLLFGQSCCVFTDDTMFVVGLIKSSDLYLATLLCLKKYRYFIIACPCKLIKISHTGRVNDLVGFFFFKDHQR